MKVRFGIMADAHVDFIHDGEKRVNTFLNACQEIASKNYLHL